MKKYYLGIDLGTSSVKLLLVTAEGESIRTKCRYDAVGPEGWCNALKKAFAEIGEKADLSDVAAIAISSQVGTYITDSGEVIGWNSNAGAEELAEIKAKISDSEFAEEIDMVHPNLISYPLPRLLYIKRHFPECKKVIMPKEFLLKELTGITVTDIFSQRGICHPEKKQYTQKLMKKLELDVELAPIQLPTDLAGGVTAAAAESYGLEEGTPVYIGCNDFFAGLLGLGVYECGTVFELSGTSEHLGVITEERMDGKFVSGRYFNGNATYGGTKASGMACDFAIKTFGLDGISPDIVYNDPPIFLPYLKGERAPIFDENAKGVFFGITEKTTKQEMAYAVLEGVVFSLYHIGKALSIESVKEIKVGGGSAGDAVMTRLRAELFGCRIVRAAENESSALGAAMIAMVGSGRFGSFEEAIGSVVKYSHTEEPDGKLRKQLLKRFAVYEQLYPSLTKQFEEFSNL
ncbi:MAG: hypothetical protein IJF27_06325 [Oscillospiraceae bacterium]|nr:hypothetical protein [Oscillospiraceae bacterium]